MAGEKSPDYRTFCAEDNDEIEGLNEKLIQLLSAQKLLSPIPNSLLCDDKLENNSSSNVESKASSSPFSYCRHDCSLLHHDSPAKVPSIQNHLPPIGVFWDIENCQVPKGRSAIAVTQLIRDKFFSGYREAEFIVVCDVQKENSQIVQELNDAQVNLIHVAATCKNAADEKLKQSIRRFGDIHGSPAAIILISGDVNFAADLSDLRHRKKIYVILLHKKNTSEALILCANEHYDFMELTEPLPSRPPPKGNEFYDLLVSNLPDETDVNVIKRRLKQLSENCGGRVIDVQSNTAIVRFTSHSSADRAQKRMEGEYVLGSKIFVKYLGKEKGIIAKSIGSIITRSRAVSESEIVTGPKQSSSKQMYAASASVLGTRTLQFPHYQSSSSVVGPYPAFNAGHCAPVNGPPSGMMQQPPIFFGRSYPNSGDVAFNRTYNDLTRVQSPLIWPIVGPQYGHMWEEYKVSFVIFMQSDGNFAASVKVPSLSDAQYAISQLHRRKIGYKRILISYAHIGGPNPQLIRAQIVMLLQEVPGHKLPLFKFREMYESRFMISISVSELYKMRDVCIITEDPSGRMVSLNPDHRNTPSPCFSNTIQDGQVKLPYCIMHTSKPLSDKGWAEQEMASLPNVKISIKLLESRMQQLLMSHNGILPLPSLPNCYEAEFKEQLEIVENGVPLEHLVSCLSCVELRQDIGSVKFIVWIGKKDHEINYDENKCVSPPLANQLALFSRELVDLLKTAPHCQLSFNRFIPAYHHHFGRQCRVADYGFTKLIDLLEALTHTVQVMGEGNKRVVTLSHRAQVRRFTSDLLRVLKSKASKQVALSEFPSVYTRVIAKPWDIVDYGVCDIEDILGEVSENTVVVTPMEGGDKMIAIPKREQTAEEIERTKLFAKEVIELLQHAPQCRMLFNKFVPSYHHHFGHQCRVSDYGFTKLIELFEAIPDVVKIEEVNGGERQISLTEKEGLKVLSEQISKLVMRARSGLSISNIGQTFLHQFGYALRPELFGCSSMLQLMRKLGDTIQIIDLATGPAIITIDKSHLQQTTLQCRRVLMDQPQQKMPLREFVQQYSQYYMKPYNVDEFKKDLANVVRFTVINGEQFIELTPLHRFACNLYRVMINCGGTLNLSQFDVSYSNIIGTSCKPAQYGFPTITALLQALPCTVTIKETRKKEAIIYLNKKLSASAGILLLPVYKPMSSYHDTDSSNDSFESDSSCRVNASNTLGIMDDHEKWIDQLTNINSWKIKNDKGLWLEVRDKHWKNLSNSEERSVNWPVPESGSETFLNSLIRTPIMRNFPPPPPKPDSPPEDKEEHWKSSVWMSPTKFAYPQDEHPTNVQVPPLTLPSWNQILSGDGTSNLLSPTKNLLPAAANPLYPPTSPYYPKSVVAPHPSELPLPSLSLTPKKKILTDNQKKTASNTRMHLNLASSESEDNVIDDDENSDSHSTSSKLFKGKRRLAAQFNQPIEP
ncbi:meiosis regulator and mRNA stability factor 1 [Pogonomyrmex barbatus]|uniref:Meiosis regulator and mRNA stability factor 1 n=1 Tax=Pogonomyrmex barbatus TaxID=144034 RepID=A0A8N1S4N1_9HYME|nr:meiosis regulator and mRNA stability factor 1 [Pogonomyrmex barbatus]